MILISILLTLMDIPGYCCRHESSARSPSCRCWSTRTLFHCAVCGLTRSSLSNFYKHSYSQL